MPSCKSACLDTYKCTAINWNRNDNDCVLRACQLVEPNWDHNQYQGHRIVVGSHPLRWKQSAKIYNNDICCHLKNIHNQQMSLESCKSACLNEKRCTALNWNGNSKNCVLRACPIVSPNWDYHNSTYEGYSIFPPHQTTRGGTCHGKRGHMRSRDIPLNKGWIKIRCNGKTKGRSGVLLELL